MRLVKKSEFLTLPEGTLFARLQQEWVFTELSVKGESLGNNDFWETPLGWIESDNSGIAIERLDEMMSNSSVSYPAQDTIQREGLYDASSVYLVYEKADVDKLIERLRAGYGAD